MEVPSPKRLRLEKTGTDDTSTSEGSNMASVASKTRVVLALCGSFSPVTNLHLRMFGMVWQQLFLFINLNTASPLCPDSRTSQGLPASHWEI